MKRNAMVRKLRLLALAGVVAATLGAGAKYASNTHKPAVPSVVISNDVLKASVLIADGSESTGGGKPTKPHG